MDTDILPDGHTVRVPVPSDAEAFGEYVRAYTRSILGFPDFTVDDARDQLTELDAEADGHGRLVHDRSGRLAGFATVLGHNGSDQVGIEVMAPDPAVSRRLFGWALDRAREVGRAHGHPKITIDHGVYRADEPLRTRVEALGFHLATTFHRMRVDHDRPATPEPPAGVVLRVAADPAVRVAAHSILEASFADHFGFVPKPFAEWHEGLDRHSTFDWSQLWVAELDGRAVGVLLCNNQYVVEENRGYVADLGVLPEARGRGIAKYLLRHAFAVDAAAGRTGTALHVDSNNTTPALGVYTSVGMRPVLVIDVWRLRSET